MKSFGAVAPFLQAATANEPLSFGWWLVWTVIKMLVVFTVIMVGVALLTLAERKI